MNSINKIQNPSQTVPGSSPIPSSEGRSNPIDPQAGSLHSHEALSLQNRSVASSFGDLAQDPSTKIDDRFKCAKLISDAKTKDEVLLEKLKDKGSLHAWQLEEAIMSLSQQEDRDAVCLELAKDTDQGIGDRLALAKLISGPKTKDEALHAILKDKSSLAPWFLNELIQCLSQQEDRDEAWLNLARDTDRRIEDRISAAIRLSDAKLRTHVLVELYNESVDGYRLDIAKIITAIPDERVKALVRQASVERKSLTL